MRRWGSLVARRARAVLVIGVVVVLGAAVWGIGVFGSLSNGGFDDPASESARSLALEQKAFGGREADLVVMYANDDVAVADPAFERTVRGVLAGLPKAAVARTVTWWDTRSPDLVSADGHATRVVVTLAGRDQDAKSDDWKLVEDRFAAAGYETNIAGPWAVFGDVNEQVSADIARAESLSMPVVFLLSLLIFGSVVAALMPTLVGGIAVMGAFAVVRGVTEVTEVSIFSINVITLLGMGLAIDYALFVVSRFREELAALGPDGGSREVRGDHVALAVERTLATAGRTVLFSGLIVAASLASLLLFPQTFLRSMGYGGVAAVLVAMTAALTVLPALLRVLGPRIDAGRLPWVARRAARARGAVAEGTTGAWARLARGVMRRPVIVLVAVTTGLLALASPFLGAKWGSVDERVLPASAPSRIAADAQSARFGGERSTATSVLDGVDAAVAGDYATALGRLPGVLDSRVVGSTTLDGRPVALVQTSWSGNAQTAASQQLVRDIRGVDPSEGTALVGGQSANAVDLVDSIGAHLPWMALVVAAVMLVLLFVAFGSLVLPLKAVVMNAVSIGASFGVVTWVFQQGHLSGPLGFTSPGYLDVTQPILMLAIIFGLSMDYEVFLLSRVREEWDRSHDNTHAVAVGLQRSGRIITSAALLLAVVIGGFTTSGIVFLKMIGLGMLVAVLLDATVVRALLVPATMRLLGRANWWAPAPMRAWWERHGHREDAPMAVTAEERADDGTDAPAGSVPQLAARHGV